MHIDRKMKNVNYLHVSFVQSHYQSEKALLYNTKC